MLDAFDCRELRSQHVDNSGRQRGHRARAADDEHVIAPRRFIERVDAAYVRACIGEVDVVSTRFDTRSSNDIVLSLERASRVNNDVRAELPQLRREVRRMTIERRRFCVRTHFIRNCPRLLQIPACHDDALPAIGRQRRDDPSPEVAITTEDDRTSHTTAQSKKRSAISAVGTRQAERRPNMR